jgi:MFS superfamily sulfate permease-like transporter
LTRDTKSSIVGIVTFGTIGLLTYALELPYPIFFGLLLFAFFFLCRWTDSQLKEASSNVDAARQRYKAVLAELAVNRNNPKLRLEALELGRNYVGAYRLWYSEDEYTQKHRFEQIRDEVDAACKGYVSDENRSK